MQGGDLQQSDQIFHAEERVTAHRSRPRCRRTIWPRKRRRDDRDRTECLGCQPRGRRGRLVTSPFPWFVSGFVYHDTLPEVGPVELHARQPGYSAKPGNPRPAGSIFTDTHSFVMTLPPLFMFSQTLIFSVHRRVNLHPGKNSRGLPGSTRSLIMYF